MIVYGAITISYVLLSISLFLGSYRLIRGPTSLDRILAFDTLTITILGFIVVLSIQSRSIFYVEVFLLFCLLGFTSTVAFLDYLLDLEIEEKRDE